MKNDIGQPNTFPQHHSIGLGSTLFQTVTAHMDQWRIINQVYSLTAVFSHMTSSRTTVPTKVINNV